MFLFKPRIPALCAIIIKGGMYWVANYVPETVLSIYKKEIQIRLEIHRKYCSECMLGEWYMFFKIVEKKGNTILFCKVWDI